MIEQLTKMVEQQTKMVEQQTIMGNQLQYVGELVERKTAEKNGSKASVGEFNRFFSFSIFPAELWLTARANTEFRNSARNLIRAHQSAMKIKRDAGLVKEVEDVQGPSKELLQQLMNLFFHGQHVEIISERHYSCKVTNRLLESIRYSGETDAVIKSTEYDIATLCWEIKNQLIDLRGGGEIAQTAAEVNGELESMWNRFDVKPPRYAAVLTNGVGFLFVMATLVNGMYSWRHSPLVTNAASAAAMIEGSFAVAAEVLQLSTESFDFPIERLQLMETTAVLLVVHREARELVGPRPQREVREVWELKSREIHRTIASLHSQYPMLICSTGCAVVFQFLIFKCVFVLRAPHEIV